MMTRREVFEKVKAHLLSQNGRSRNGLGDCLYRGPGDMKCAVGCLIANEHYNLGLENKLVFDSEVRASLEKSGVPTDHCTINMLSALQVCHDDEEVNDWPEYLDAIERRYFT